MLTLDELTALEGLLRRARHAAARGRAATAETITPGDVVQLRPGIDATWDCSLLLVQHVDHYAMRGPILRPHRSGCREAWYKFRAGEVLRIGRMPYPEPPPEIRQQCYAPECPLRQRKPPAAEGQPAPTFRQAQAITRQHSAAFDREFREMLAHASRKKD